LQARYKKDPAQISGGNMKALTTQIAERKAWLIENHKCVVADFSPLTFYRENGELDEEKTLSAINKYSKSKGFKESVEIRESGKKITRNNGSSREITETSVSRDERILHVMADSRFSYREACFLIGETPERDAKQPASITESIAKRWKKYAPWISTKDANTLAEMGKLP
jgi:hypothetical protein